MEFKFKWKERVLESNEDILFDLNLQFNLIKKETSNMGHLKTDEAVKSKSRRL